MGKDTSWIKIQPIATHASRDRIVPPSVFEQLPRYFRSSVLPYFFRSLRRRISQGQHNHCYPRMGFRYQERQLLTHIAVLERKAQRIGRATAPPRNQKPLDGEEAMRNHRANHCTATRPNRTPPDEHGRRPADFWRMRVRALVPSLSVSTSASLHATDPPPI